MAFRKMKQSEATGWRLEEERRSNDIQVGPVHLGKLTVIERNTCFQGRYYNQYLSFRCIRILSTHRFLYLINSYTQESLSMPSSSCRMHCSPSTSFFLCHWNPSLQACAAIIITYERACPQYPIKLMLVNTFLSLRFIRHNNSLL